MTQFDKIIDKILRGTSDSNIDFSDVCHLLQNLGFHERIKGSHHIFYRENVEEFLNLQAKGSSAKAYQIRQVRELIIKSKLHESLS